MGRRSGPALSPPPRATTAVPTRRRAASGEGRQQHSHAEVRTQPCKCRAQGPAPRHPWATACGRHSSLSLECRRCTGVPSCFWHLASNADWAARAANDENTLPEPQRAARSSSDQPVAHTSSPHSANEETPHKPPSVAIGCWAIFRSYSSQRGRPRRFSCSTDANAHCAHKRQIGGI